MKTPTLLIAAALYTVILCTAVKADIGSATDCAALLTVEQKLIYKSVLPDLKPQADLRALVRSKTIELAKAGRLKMSSAPDDAKIAHRCLKMVRQ
jgi:hypothetical protein